MIRMFSTVLLVAALAAAQGQSLERAPYLQNMKTDSVEILWVTDEPTESWVEITSQPDGKTDVWHSNIPRKYHQLEVPRLEPDSIYKYRVGYGNEKYFDTHSSTLRTFPPEGTDEFQFVVYGDHRNYPEDHAAVVQAILKMMKQRGRPLFVLDSGDFTGQGEQTKEPYDREFFGPAAELIAQVPYFPAVGNHESPRQHPRIPLRYLKYFSVPTENSGTEYYYSFDVGNAHFCVIDSYASDYAEGSKQYAWIEKDLKESKRPWKFTMTHHPFFIKRVAPNVSYGIESLRESLVPLFQEHGVAMHFNGDSHFYQRSLVDGITYVNSGGGGAPLYTPAKDEPYVQAAAEAHHYVWISINGTTMHAWAYDKNNELLDEFTATNRVAITPTPVPTNFVRQLPAESAEPVQEFIVESRTKEGGLGARPDYVELGGMMDSSAKSGAPGVKGRGSRFSMNEAVDAAVMITPPLDKKGKWLISITVPEAESANAPNSIFEVQSPGQELIRGLVDLTPQNAGSKWYPIGMFELAPGASIKLIEPEGAPDRFYVDSVRFSRFE